MTGKSGGQNLLAVDRQVAGQRAEFDRWVRQQQPQQIRLLRLLSVEPGQEPPDGTQRTSQLTLIGQPGVKVHDTTTLT